MKFVPSNFSIPELLPSLTIASTLTLALIPFVGSQIILSRILAIQNNNHTQEHKIYLENPFSLKGKTTGQILNNFTIVKSITIIIVYVSRLKKNLSYFSFHTHTHTHTLIISFKSGNTLLSSFYFLLYAQLSLGYLLFL